MSAALKKRADDLRASYKQLEAVRGSGYHDDDKNPANPTLHLAPQRNGLPRMSEHVVAFFDHDGDETVEFVGDDAKRAHDALQQWLARNKKGDPTNKPGTERKLIQRLIPRLSVETVDGLPRLSVWLCDWNDVLFALQAEGVGVAGLPFEE